MKTQCQDCLDPRPMVCGACWRALEATFDERDRTAGDIMACMCGFATNVPIIYLRHRCLDARRVPTAGAP
jgi:hypothetical protein